MITRLSAFGLIASAFSSGELDVVSEKLEIRIIKSKKQAQNLISLNNLNN